MKTNPTTLNSFLYTFLDKYIYYIVVKKSHKQLVNEKPQENVVFSNRKFSQA